MLSIMIFMLYITLPRFLYFITGGLFLFIHITYFILLPQTLSPVETTLFCSVFMSLFAFCFGDLLFQFLDSRYRRDNMIFIIVSLLYFTEPNTLQIHACCWNMAVKFEMHLNRSLMAMLLSRRWQFFSPRMGWHRQLFSLLGIHFLAFVCGYPVSQHHLLKRLAFPHCVFLVPLSHISGAYLCGFISGLHVLFHFYMSIFMSTAYCIDL